MAHKLWEEIKNIRFEYSSHGPIDLKEYVLENNFLYTVLFSIHNIFESTDITEMIEIYKYIEEIEKRKILILIITNTFHDSMFNFLNMLKSNFNVNLYDKHNIIFLPNIQKNIINTQEFIYDNDNNIYPSRNTIILDNKKNMNVRYKEHYIKYFGRSVKNILRVIDRISMVNANIDIALPVAWDGQNQLSKKDIDSLIIGKEKYDFNIDVVNKYVNSIFNRVVSNGKNIPLTDLNATHMIYECYKWKQPSDTDNNNNTSNQNITGDLNNWYNNVIDNSQSNLGPSIGQEVINIDNDTIAPNSDINDINKLDINNPESYTPEKEEIIEHIDVENNINVDSGFVYLSSFLICDYKNDNYITELPFKPNIYAFDNDNYEIYEEYKWWDVISKEESCKDLKSKFFKLYNRKNLSSINSTRKGIGSIYVKDNYTLVLYGDKDLNESGKIAKLVGPQVFVSTDYMYDANICWNANITYVDFKQFDGSYNLVKTDSEENKKINTKFISTDFNIISGNNITNNNTEIWFTDGYIGNRKGLISGAGIYPPYTSGRYNTGCQSRPVGDYPDMEKALGETIDPKPYVKGWHGKSWDGTFIPKGYELILYSHKNFEGESITYQALNNDIYLCTGLGRNDYAPYTKGIDVRKQDTKKYGKGSFKFKKISYDIDELKIENRDDWNHIKNNEYYYDEKGSNISKPVYTNKNDDLSISNLGVFEVTTDLKEKTPDEILRYTIDEDSNMINIVQIDKDNSKLQKNNQMECKLFIYDDKKYEIKTFETLYIKFAIVDNDLLGFTNTTNKLNITYLTKVRNILYNLQNIILKDNKFFNSFTKIKYKIDYYNCFGDKVNVLTEELNKDDILFTPSTISNTISFNLYDKSTNDINKKDLLDSTIVFNGLKELNTMHSYQNGKNNNYKIPFIEQHNDFINDNILQINSNTNDFNKKDNEPEILFYLSNFHNGYYHFPINPNDIIIKNCLLNNSYKNKPFNSGLNDTNHSLDVKGFYHYYFMISIDQSWDLKYPYLYKNTLNKYNANTSKLTKDIDNILLKNLENNIRYYSNNSKMLKSSVSQNEKNQMINELSYYFAQEYLTNRVKNYADIEVTMDGSQEITKKIKTNNNGFIIDSDILIDKDDLNRIYKCVIKYNNKYYEIIRATYDNTKTNNNDKDNSSLKIGGSYELSWEQIDKYKIKKDEEERGSAYIDEEGNIISEPNVRVDGKFTELSDLDKIFG